MTEEPAFSSLVMGATYALFRGDLETASVLGRRCIEESPFEIEAHIILVHAFCGLEDWRAAAQHGRYALCLGARDPQVGSFMSGVYRALEMSVEAEWVEERCNAETFEITWTMDPEEENVFRRELSAPPRMLKARSWPSQGEMSNHLGDSSAFSWGGHAMGDLPDWLEANDMMDLNEIAPLREGRLDWLSEESDSLDVIFTQVEPYPHWLEASETIEDVIGSNETSSSQGHVHLEDRSLSTAAPTLEDQEAGRVDHLSTKEEDKEDALLASASHASLLGVGSNFRVAIDLDALTLTAAGAKPKTLFGPLILALTEDRLILVAYEDEFVRQKPWAFSADQLRAVSAKETEVSLIVEGEREVAFSLENSLIAAELVECLKAWR